MGPRVYADEAIPSALCAEDIARTLDVTRRNRQYLDAGIMRWSLCWRAMGCARGK